MTVNSSNHQGAIKGLTMFGEAMVNSVTGTKTQPPRKAEPSSPDNGHRPGIVSIIDVQNIAQDHVSHNLTINQILLNAFK